MTELKWQPISDNSVEIADGDFCTYLITTDRHKTSLTRWASDEVGSWWIAAQAARYTISMPHYGIGLPETDEVIRKHFREWAQMYESGLDVPGTGHESWQRP